MSRYSLKNIFLGIGIGLIIASALNLNTPKAELSIQDIRSEAEKRGMIVLEPGEAVNKPQSGQTTSTPPTSEPVNPTPPQLVEIRIKSGDTAENVGIMLEASGLVNDRQDFIKRIYATKNGHRMQTGKFTFEKGSSIDDIIKIITTKKNTPR